MNIKEVLRNNLTFYLFLFFVVVFIIGAIVNLVLWRSTQFEKTITVSEKYIRARKRTSTYHVVDENGENYKLDNVWFKGDFNRVNDEYGILKAGESFKVKGYGKRVPLFDMYRIIYSVEKV